MKGLRLTAAEIEAIQARVRSGHDKNRHSGSGTNVEQHPGDAAQATDETQKALPRVVIRFTHYRRKPADVDNFATKHFVDALVANGVLRDDSPKEVEEVRHRQVIIPPWDDERMEIEIMAAC